MTKASEFGPVSAYVRKRIHELLDEHRVVVWYDPEGAFSEFINQLALQGGMIVSAVDSRLRARRAAEAVYRRLNEANGSLEARKNLLIYLRCAGSYAGGAAAGSFRGLRTLRRCLWRSGG